MVPMRMNPDYTGASTSGMQETELEFPDEAQSARIISDQGTESIILGVDGNETMEISEGWNEIEVLNSSGQVIAEFGMHIGWT
jgi:hypothetical protein